MNIFKLFQWFHGHGEISWFTKTSSTRYQLLSGHSIRLAHQQLEPRFPNTNLLRKKTILFYSWKKVRQIMIKNTSPTVSSRGRAWSKLWYWGRVVGYRCKSVALNPLVDFKLAGLLMGRHDIVEVIRDDKILGLSRFFFFYQRNANTNNFIRVCL